MTLEEILNAHMNGHPDAVRFFHAWNDYCHAVDDCVDEFVGKPLPPERLLKLLAQAAALYSSNFYTKYAQWLYPIVLQITNAYADSVLWEGSAHISRARMSDHLRSAGNEMLLTIVGLVAGWDTLRVVSPLLREHSWNCHHDETGKPT